MKAKFFKYKWYIAIIGLILLNFVRQGYLNHTLEKEMIIKSHGEIITQNQEKILEQTKQDKIENKEIEIEENEETNLEPVPVYICGAVQNPGVYYVLEDSIVDDVVRQSGGLAEDADLEAINLASSIQGNSKIVIPSQEEKFDKLLDLYENNNKETNNLDHLETTSPIKQINLNTATKEELMSLNGIGEVKANDIIHYRTEKNKFQSIEEIKQISGIGEKIFEKIKSFITV